MYRVLYFVLLGVAVQGSPVLDTSEDIPEIRVNLLHTFDPPGFSISWDPVKTSNQRDPIIGIKVKVWKTPCVLKTVYQVSGGNLTKVLEYEPQTYNTNTVPNSLPEYVVIVKPDEVTATIPHIDLETWYHIRALAFNSTAEGKYSNPTDFKLNSNNEDDKNTSSERIFSETLVKSVHI